MVFTKHGLPYYILAGLLHGEFVLSKKEEKNQSISIYPRGEVFLKNGKKCRIIPLPLITLDFFFFFSKYKVSKSVGKLGFSWVKFQRDKGGAG